MATGSGLTLTPQLSSFSFTETTPHTAELIPPHRILEAFATHRASGTHGLRLSRGFSPRRKEIDDSHVLEALGVLPPVRREARFHCC